MFNYVVYGVVSFFVLLAIFAQLAPLKRKTKRLPRWLYFALYPVGICFIICDALWNILFGSLLFWQLPHKTRLTLTGRMKHLLITDDGWRFKMAYFICRYLVEPWDWNHCGLKDI